MVYFYRFIFLNFSKQTTSLNRHFNINSPLMASITYSKVLEWIAWMIVNLFLEISGHLYARAQGKASIPQKPRTNFKRWNWKGRQSRRWIDGFLRSICWFFVLFWSVLVGKVYQCQWCFSFLAPKTPQGTKQWEHKIRRCLSWWKAPRNILTWRSLRWRARIGEEPHNLWWMRSFSKILPLKINGCKLGSCHQTPKHWGIRHVLLSKLSLKQTLCVCFFTWCVLNKTDIINQVILCMNVIVCA